MNEKELSLIDCLRNELKNELRKRFPNKEGEVKIKTSARAINEHVDLILNGFEEKSLNTENREERNSLDNYLSKIDKERKNDEELIVSPNTLKSFLYEDSGAQIEKLHTYTLYLNYVGWYHFIDEQNDSQIPKEPKSQTSEFHLEMLTGSKNFYEQRYRQLNISEILLPNWKGESNDIDADVKLGDDENTCSLISGVEKLWESENKNCLLIGEGGMGKTFSLVQIWKHYLNKKETNSPIPIYVSLNRYNDVKEEERESFITNYIIENYFQKRFFSDTEKQNLWNLLLNNSKLDQEKIPTFILLLDGFNEITANQMNIRKDMDDWWFSKAKGFQIIISSRYDMRLDYRWHNLQKIELQPLSVHTINLYLDNLKINIPKDAELLTLLSNPMMLTLYASTNEVIDRYSKYPKFTFKLEFTSQGELMWNFFEGQLAKYFETIKYDDTEFIYYSFLLKHLIPFVGYKMEKQGMYNIHENKLLEIINEGCIDFYNESFEYAFPVYREHISKFDLGEKQFPHSGARFKKITDILCEKLQILIKENYSYKFLHQNFRDFSASVHYLNDININFERKTIPTSLKDKPLPIYIQRFIGEIEGEHKKKVTFSKKKDEWVNSFQNNNLLDRQLDFLRGTFDDSAIGYAVRNIVEIYKHSRQELTGSNLANLNLKHISFNGIKCYRKWKDKAIGVTFDNSLITDDNFSSETRHLSSVYSVCYSPDGTRFVSGSYDKTVKLWDSNITI